MFLNPQHIEELVQSDLNDFLHDPNDLPQEPSKAGKGTMEEGPPERLHPREGKNFFAQLDKPDDRR